jgi:hypothetical protein
MLSIIGEWLAISVFETKDQAEASAATVSPLPDAPLGVEDRGARDNRHRVKWDGRGLG